MSSVVGPAGALRPAERGPRGAARGAVPAGRPDPEAKQLPRWEGHC